MKRFLSLYILLLPAIIFGVMYLCYFSYTLLPDPGYTFRRLCLWFFYFFIFFLSFVCGIVALIVYGAAYAEKMSLIEASIWNIFTKISYFFIHIGLGVFWTIMWENNWKSAWWELIFEFLLPPLLILYSWVISGVYSAFIYGTSGKKGVWTNSIVILFGCLSFIFGIDFILAIAHIGRCCMINDMKQSI